MNTDVDELFSKFTKRLSDIKAWKKHEELKPHKYILLLAIIKLLEKNHRHPNAFTFDELETLFGETWEECNLGARSAAFLEYPYYHLSSEGFWHFRVKEGAEALFEKYKTSQSPRYRFTKARIRETIEYAYLDDELFLLFSEPYNRHKVRKAILLHVPSRAPDPLEANESTSLFSHEASAIESIKGDILRLSIGKLVSNLLLYEEQTNDYYESDVIIITPCGIYVAELKHWSGKIRIASYNWVKDEVNYRRDPHATNTFKAKILKGIYQHQFRTFPAKLRVESVVVLTNPEAEVEGASNPKTDKHCPTFDSIENFIDYLRHQNATKAKILSLHEIERIADYLESLRQPKRRSRYSFHDYEVVEHLTQRPDLVEVVARPTTGRHRRLLRFRVFSPPINAEMIEKQRFMKRARNTLDAVSQIGDHPNVLKVWPVPDESGAVIEGSDWSEEGTLRDRILTQNGPFAASEALAICIDLSRALQVAHSNFVIHRAVKPENVLMAGGTAKLMNFDLSYQLASDPNITIIPDGSVLKRDAYTAPEVFHREDVDESTDLFSVGVILYELLVGERPFKASTDLERLGGRLTDDSLSKLRAKKVSQHVIEAIERLVRSDRTERIRSAEGVLACLRIPKGGEIPDQRPIPNQRLAPGTSYDVYTIEKLVGEGAEAQVYEARTHRNESVALKIFNRDIPLTRILDEEHAASAVKSSYLAFAKRSGHWNNDRYFIEMNFIDGHLMREDIAEGRLPDKDIFVKITSCLLEAVQVLHHRLDGEEEFPLLHCDIKPDNIMLRPDDSAVLFDFGCAGPPRVDKYQGTDGYVAPDLMSGADLQFCESGDLFALGISLFEWLYGKRPYEKTRLSEAPSVPAGVQADFPEPLLKWLLRAIETESAGRYQDIDEMHAAFVSSLKESHREQREVQAEPVSSMADKKIVEPIVQEIRTEQQGNPFVAYLNSLHNASANNENALAESQAMSPFFGFIHVPMKATEYICEQLTAEHGSHVILTGHAGDGKSTIGLELFRHAKGIPKEQRLEHRMHAREEISLEGREVILIKDMSEIGESECSHLLKDAYSQDHRRYFIISNTGALLNAFERLAEKQEWLDVQSELLAALEAGIPKSFHFRGGQFKIINLVRADNISTACRIFERMLAAERWKPCENATCREKCPIYCNVQILRECWDIVKRRLELAYRRLFEYGSRLTLREITGQLAYSITAGLSYEDVGRLSGQAKPFPLRHFLFFNRFFGDRGDASDPAANQLAAIRAVRTLEPGLRTHQRLERQLWMSEDGNDLPLFGNRLMNIYDYLRQAGAGKLQSESLPRESARMQVRRLLYFYGNFESEEVERGFVSVFLNSPMILELAKWQKVGGPLALMERRKLKQGILHVLQEHFTGIRLPENAGDQGVIYMTLNRRDYEIRQSAQIVLAKFHADNFEVVLKPVDSGISDTRYELLLQETTTQKLLNLELPFLDFVTNRYHGEIAQRLQSFYADRLEHFKVGLLNSKGGNQEGNMMLIRLQLNHRFKSQILSVRNNILEVTS